MTQIVLNAEQARAILNAHEPIQVCGPNGDVLGVLTPQTSREEIDRLKEIAKSDGPWYTTQQVLDHLRSLEP